MGRQVHASSTETDSELFRIDNIVPPWCIIKVYVCVYIYVDALQKEFVRWDNHKVK